MSEKPISLSRVALATLVNTFVRGYPDPENPQPPGPWDPIIHRVIKRSGPHPQPWIGAPFPEPWISGPFPLPWSIRFANSLVEEVAADALFIRQARDRGDDQAKDMIFRFIDDCGNGRLRWPFPWPPPPWWMKDVDMLGPAEFVSMGVTFNNLALQMSDDWAKATLSSAGDQLVDIGIGRL